jgi:hypothetical protein
MNKNAFTFTGIVLAATLAGCGPGSGGSGSFSTSVPGGDQVQNLSPAQAGQFCSDISAYLTNQIVSPGLCQAAAVVATASQAMQDPSISDAQLQLLCSYVATSVCQVLSADAGAGGSGSGAPSCGSTAGCTATVAQISACVEDTGSSFATFEGMFPSCSMVTRARLASINQNASPMQPASCASLGTSCPNFRPMLSLGALGTID